MLSGRRVAVIVAVYNAEATIGPCITSLLEMSSGGCEVELIVVENGSTDGSVSILSSFGDRLRMISESRRGPAAARNRAILETSAEWIAFTDADCVVEREWLAELVQPLSEEGVGIVGGRILSVEPCNRIERFGERIHDHRIAIERQNPPYAMTGNWASPREALIRTGMFDETLLRGSDADLAFRLHAAGYRIVYRHGAVVHHRNESTFRGLFHEGYMHGMGGAALRRKPVHGMESRRRRIATGRRVARSLGQAITGRGSSRFENLCAAVFDAGKLIGELKG